MLTEVFPFVCVTMASGGAAVTPPTTRRGGESSPSSAWFSARLNKRAMDKDEAEAKPPPAAAATGPEQKRLRIDASWTVTPVNEEDWAGKSLEAHVRQLVG